jgi:hypothetical protein
MKRMLLATVILILTSATFLISYSIVSLPLEYTIDPLLDSYDSLAENNSWNDGDNVNNVMLMLPYFLSGGVLLGVLLISVWYFAYAHKREHEQY